MSMAVRECSVEYMGLIHIGTSGWSYKEWANDFYHGLKPKEHFQFYATQFSTVEINASFYRLPDLKTVHGWHDINVTTPLGMKFPT